GKGNGAFEKGLPVVIHDMLHGIEQFFSIFKIGGLASRIASRINAGISVESWDYKPRIIGKCPFTERFGRMLRFQDRILFKRLSRLFRLNVIWKVAKAEHVKVPKAFEHAPQLANFVH